MEDLRQYNHRIADDRGNLHTRKAIVGSVICIGPAGGKHEGDGGDGGDGGGGGGTGHEPGGLRPGAPASRHRQPGPWSPQWMRLFRRIKPSLALVPWTPAGHADVL